MRTLQKLFAIPAGMIIFILVFIGITWLPLPILVRYVSAPEPASSIQKLRRPVARPVVTRYHRITPDTIGQKKELRFDCIKNHTSNSIVELIIHNDNNNIENGEEVTISWTGVSSPSPKDWIGLFCPTNSPIDVYCYHWFVKESLTYLNGYGEVAFVIYNIRTDCEFRYYSNETCNILLAHSAPLRFKGGANKPLHGHIALTGNPSEMRIQWTSGTKATPTVNYGYSTTQLNHVAMGVSRTYTANDMCTEPATNPKYFIDPGFLHDVILTKLPPNIIIFYQFGSEYAMSPVYNFTTAPSADSTKGFSFITYGDMGISPSPGAKDIAYNVIKEIENGVNFVLHQGDLSYAVGYGYVWEQWMNLIEPIATRVPYMIGIGNHEQNYKTTNGSKDGFHPSWGNYGDDSNGECGVPTRNRFHMPDNGNNIYWYSFDYGPVHFTFISTEHNFTLGTVQYDWIERDFKGVDRHKTPWLLVIGHRPMYTSEDYPSDYRVSLHMQSDGLEDLFHHYSVDMAIWGHYHSYERTCKVYKGKCTSTGVVNIVIGSAGASLDSALQYKVEWSKHLEMNYGYGRVTIANQSALLWEYIRNVDTVVSDRVWLMK